MSYFIKKICLFLQKKVTIFVQVGETKTNFLTNRFLEFQNFVFRSRQSLYFKLARTPEIGQGLRRILSCGARKPEQI